MEVTLQTLAELSAFSKRFIDEFPRGSVVGLSGELGAGKTAFVRACLEYLALKSHCPSLRVASPSFVLHQSYPDLTPPVDHFDLYRFESVDAPALMELGYFDVVSHNQEQGGFVFVEWAEKAESGLLGLNVEMSVELMGTRRRFSWEFV